jgi:hypothetical protein
MNLLGLNFRDLNLAIPYAVQSGFRYPAFAFLPGLRCQPLRAKLFELMLRAFRATRHTHLGRFRERKLVGSGQHSKCFFAGVQCSGLMPTSWQRGCAAHR